MANVDHFVAASAPEILHYRINLGSLPASLLMHHPRIHTYKEQKMAEYPIMDQVKSIRT